MRQNQLVTWVVLVAFIAGLPAVCAAQSVRVIPKGTLTVVENGKPVGEFTSEVPLPEGSSLVCSGQCLVRGEKFQLLAHDKAQFSLVKKDKEWVLTVKSGTVEFTMGQDVKLAFVTPNGKYHKVTKTIPATALVSGRVDVTATSTKFATAAGVQFVTSPEGEQVIQTGRDAQAAAGTTPMWPFVVGGVAAAGAGLGIAAALGAFSSSKPAVSPH